MKGLRLSSDDSVTHMKNTTWNGVDNQCGIHSQIMKWNN